METLKALMHVFCVSHKVLVIYKGKFLLQKLCFCILQLKVKKRRINPVWETVQIINPNVKLLLFLRDPPLKGAGQNIQSNINFPDQLFTKCDASKVISYQVCLRKFPETLLKPS